MQRVPALLALAMSAILVACEENSCEGAQCSAAAFGEFSFHGSSPNLNKRDLEYAAGLNEFWEESPGQPIDKLRSFTKFVPRTDLARFLVKYELFTKIVDVHGVIVECGVHMGGGLMAWAQLSALLEPINHLRRVYGFDTFGPGFVEERTNEAKGDALPWRGFLQTGEGVVRHLERAVKLYDVNRYISHVPKVELVPGDITLTAPEFVEKNPHLVVSLLYLDVDHYEPTKAALEAFLPRMPKGGVIVFDELNIKEWAGETMAVLDVLGISNLRIRRFPFNPQISYAVIE